MRWLRRLIEWFRGGRRDAALIEELEAHRALTQDELERSGLSPADAAAESRRRMGNVTLAREDSREVWIVRWADRLRQHVRYGVRGLRREPLFALTAILTLALGSAATITVFSVVDAEVWRPLPYPDPHRLVAVRSRGAAAKSDTDGISMAEFQAWRRTGAAFNDLAAEGSWGRQTVQVGHAESILISEVTANFFATLGRTPLAGRVFTNDDAHGSGVAVLTGRGWQRIFNSDPSVVGRTFLIDGRSVAIVGLVARDDSMGPDAEMYLPIDERTSTAPLGATPRTLIRDMLWQSARLSLVAAGVGLGGALLVAKMIGNALYLVPGDHNGLLYDVRTTDPLALASALGAIMALAVVAGAVPARRAGQTNPVAALRGD